VPACLRVTLDGNDEAATLSEGALAFATVQAAIDFASENPTVATAVCVAPGSACGASGVFAYAGSLTMRDGISVYGNYESSGFTRCADSTTRLSGANGGVVFGAEIASETVLDGFVVEGRDAGIGAAIVADAARDARISNSSILASDAGDGRSIGVALLNGAELTLSEVEIEASAGALETAGVRATGATVWIDDSSIEVTGTAVTGVELINAAGSLIEGSDVSVLGQFADDAFASGVRIVGNADGTIVRANAISAKGPSYALTALAVETCVGSMTIAGNDVEANNPTEGFAPGQPPTFGVNVVGDCEARIASNTVLSAGGNDIVNVAVACEAPCSIEDNANLYVNKTGVVFLGGQGDATAVRCDGCLEITNNAVTGLVDPSGNHRMTNYYSTGMSVVGPTLVARNRITGGCSFESVGVRASGARLENNLIIGRDPSRCGFDPTMSTYSSTSIGVLAGSNLDLHSNWILAGAGEMRRFALSIAGAGTTIRNNSIVSPVASSFSPIAAAVEGTGWLAFENNALQGGVYLGPFPILETPEGINALPGASANLVADCNGGNLHLIAGSPCIDGGTPAGAPEFDWDGEARDATPDIGPDEYSTVNDVCFGVTCSGHGTCRPGPVVECACELGYAPGFTNPLECVPNPCAVDNGGCDPRTFCTRTPEGRDCSDCPQGFTGTGETACVDIDECATDNGGCDPLTVCTNTAGSRTCGPCPPNYVGTGATGCVFTNSCDPNPCQRDAACIPDVSSFTCACPTGITGELCQLTFSQISLGWYYFCGVRSDGSLRCGGNNVQVPTGTFVTVSTDQAHACALRTDGTLACFGANSSGQASPPEGTFLAVEAGPFRTCAVRSDGTLTCFGQAFLDGVTPPPGTFTSVSAGSTHACAVATDQTIVCFGTNLYGESTPPSGTFQQVSVGTSHSCGIRSDGTLACWGSNSFGEASPPAGTFQAVSSIYYFSCGIRSDGTLACWGNVPSGGPPSGTFRRLATGVNQDSGNGNACALRDDDVVLCWGASGWVAPTGGP
jgi:hypothetical protein